MVWRNPQDSKFEAELSFPLPEGGSICGYAVDVDQKLVPGVIVGKEKARATFEAEVRKDRGGPALIEQSTGNVFTTRINPFLPFGYRTIQVTFTQDLIAHVNEKGQTVNTYILPFYPSEGSTCTSSLNIEVAGQLEPRLTAGHGYKDEDTYRDVFWTSSNNAQLGVRTKSLKGSTTFWNPDGPITLELVGSELDSSLICEHSGPETITIAAAIKNIPTGQSNTFSSSWSTSKIGLLWDCSKSRVESEADIKMELSAVQAVLTHLQSRSTGEKFELDLFPFNATVSTSPIYFNTKSLHQATERINDPSVVRYHGGTNYSALSKLVSSGHTLLGSMLSVYKFWILVTDGISTFGEQSIPDLQAPVYIISAATSGDPAFLRRWARQSNGKYFNLRSGVSHHDIITGLTDEATSFLYATLGDVVLATEDTPIDEFLEVQPLQSRTAIIPSTPKTLDVGTLRFYARLNLSAPKFASLMADNAASSAAILTVHFGAKSTAHVTHQQSYEIDLHELLSHGIPTPVSMSERAWAQGRLNEVQDLITGLGKNTESEEKTKLEKEQLSLSRAFTVVTPNTSLIVLETLQQFLDHMICPPMALTDIYKQYQKRIAARIAEEESKRFEKTSRVHSWWQRRRKWVDENEYIHQRASSAAVDKNGYQIDDRKIAFRTFGTSELDFKANRHVFHEHPFDSEELNGLPISSRDAFNQQWHMAPPGEKNWPGLPFPTPDQTDDDLDSWSYEQEPCVTYACEEDARPIRTLWSLKSAVTNELDGNDPMDADYEAFLQELDDTDISIYACASSSKREEEAQEAYGKILERAEEDDSPYPLFLHDESDQLDEMLMSISTETRSTGTSLSGLSDAIKMVSQDRPSPPMQSTGKAIASSLRMGKKQDVKKEKKKQQLVEEDDEDNDIDALMARLESSITSPEPLERVSEAKKKKKPSSIPTSRISSFSSAAPSDSGEISLLEAEPEQQEYSRRRTKQAPLEKSLSQEKTKEKRQALPVRQEEKPNKFRASRKDSASFDAPAQISKAYDDHFTSDKKMVIEESFGEMLAMPPEPEPEVPVLAASSKRRGRLSLSTRSMAGDEVGAAVIPLAPPASAAQPILLAKPAPARDQGPPAVPHFAQQANSQPMAPLAPSRPTMGGKSARAAPPKQAPAPRSSRNRSSTPPGAASEESFDGVLAERTQSILSIEKEVNRTNDMFREMSSMVDEQSSMLDSIEDNIQSSRGQVYAGNNELAIASSSSTSSIGGFFSSFMSKKESVNLYSQLEESSVPSSYGSASPSSSSYASGSPLYSGASSAQNPLFMGDERRVMIGGEGGSGGGGGACISGSSSSDSSRFYPSSNAKLSAVQRDVDAVKNIMIQNIDSVLSRGERLETLSERSEMLSSSSMDFKSKSTALRYQTFRKKTVIKFGLLFIVLALLLGASFALYRFELVTAFLVAVAFATIPTTVALFWLKATASMPKHWVAYSSIWLVSFPSIRFMFYVLTSEASWLRFTAVGCWWTAYLMVTFLVIRKLIQKQAKKEKIAVAVALYSAMHLAMVGAYYGLAYFLTDDTVSTILAFVQLVLSSAATVACDDRELEPITILTVVPAVAIWLSYLHIASSWFSHPFINVAAFWCLSIALIGSLYILDNAPYDKKSKYRKNLTVVLYTFVGGSVAWYNYQAASFVLSNPYIESMFQQYAYTYADYVTKLTVALAALVSASELSRYLLDEDVLSRRSRLPKSIRSGSTVLFLGAQIVVYPSIAGIVLKASYPLVSRLFGAFVLSASNAFGSNVFGHTTFNQTVTEPTIPKEPKSLLSLWDWIIVGTLIVCLIPWFLRMIGIISNKPTLYANQASKASKIAPKVKLEEVELRRSSRQKTKKEPKERSARGRKQSPVEDGQDEQAMDSDAFVQFSPPAPAKEVHFIDLFDSYDSSAVPVPNTPMMNQYDLVQFDRPRFSFISATPEGSDRRTMKFDVKWLSPPGVVDGAADANTFESALSRYNDFVGSRWSANDASHISRVYRLAVSALKSTAASMKPSEQVIDFALTAMSNLAEGHLGKAQLLRAIAYKLEEHGLLEEAEHIYRRALELRGEEPQSYRDLALVLAKQSKFNECIALYDKILTRCKPDWDARFSQVEVVALMDLCGILPLMDRMETSVSGFKIPYSIVPAASNPVEVDLRSVLTWDVDGLDIELQVQEPDETMLTSFSNQSGTGGLLSRDFSGGYGPVEYLTRRAFPGTYQFFAKVKSPCAKPILGGEVTLRHTIFTDFGTPGLQASETRVYRFQPQHCQRLNLASVQVSQLRK